jgi:hypothetical protein
VEPNPKRAIVAALRRLRAGDASSEIESREQALERLTALVRLARCPG